MADASTPVEVPTEPFGDQKPGTSGLRKRTAVFLASEAYLANFVQSYFDAEGAEAVRGATLVVSGDGRFYSEEAARAIVRIAAANGVGRVVVGQRFLLSTPAASHLVRKLGALGAVVLTASHNPGGPDGDFGVKINTANGGPAPEAVTSAVHARTLEIRRYRTLPRGGAADTFDATRPGEHDVAGMRVEVVDPAEAYAALMREIFDFDALRELVARPDFSMRFDAMHGVAGPYARRVLCDELGADPAAVLRNAEPSPDFGGGHPDPNLTYAPELVAAMGLDARGAVLAGGGAAGDEVPDFGAAADGDADRNMVLGRRFFVTPSDSVAVLARHAPSCIPYFKGGLKGVARSMPTSRALDRVAEAAGVPLYEVPTGWKFFGNLMDAGRLSVCGEESFGTGADHVREKDGLWAVLAWLSVIAHQSRGRERPAAVADIVRAHWREFGRNYYSRHDYEGVDKEAAAGVMARLVALATGDAAEARAAVAAVGGAAEGLELEASDEFEYTDPIDGSVSLHQGVRFLLRGGSRVVFRLSGTGSVGATVRVYVERYEPGDGRLDLDTQEAVAPLVALALGLSELHARCNRESPTVIT